MASASVQGPANMPEASLDGKLREVRQGLDLGNRVRQIHRSLRRPWAGPIYINVLRYALRAASQAHQFGMGNQASSAISPNLDQPTANVAPEGMFRKREEFGDFLDSIQELGRFH